MRSDDTQEIAKALAAAQSEMKPAIRNKSNPFFKSSYADLESVCDACLHVLNKHGICVTQTTAPLDNGIALETTLIHASGQWISSVYPVHPAKNDAQSLGSAFKYARRYALSGIACVSESDDDGEEAMDRNAAEAPIKQQPKSPAKGLDNGPTRVTPAQIALLMATANQKNWTEEDIKDYLGKIGLQSRSELNYFQFQKLLESMQKFPKERG